MVKQVAEAVAEGHLWFAWCLCQWADRHEWGGTSLARGSAGYLSLPPSRSPVAFLPGIS